jgi:hypothetical protein
MSETPHCPVCASASTRPCFSSRGVPVHCNSLAPDSDSARQVVRGDLELRACEECAHVWNESFDASLLSYDESYETSLFHSGHFRAWAEKLARRLIEQYVRPGGTVVELGCGRGDFLALLANPERHRAMGFDASYDGRHDARVGMTIERTFEPPAGIANLLACRHALEHVPDPYSLLGTIQNSLADDGVAYLEVPDFGFTLERGGVFDLIYEHCAYFSAPSLARALTRAGMQAASPTSEFGGQFLSAEARLADAPEAPPTTPDVDEILALIDRFSVTYESTIARWRDALAARAGQRVALWGAGSKGVTFLNVVPGAEAIETVVDVSPDKQGRYVPGTGQRIVAPEHLRGQPVDAVVLLNPNYRGEVAATLDALGVRAELI